MHSPAFRISISVTVLLFALAACQTPEPPPTRPSSEQTIIALIETSTAYAATISAAGEPIVLSDTPTAPLTDAPITQMPTDPIAFSQPIIEASATSTPYIPPTITVTSSPSVPQVSVSSLTNCRTGPSQHYKLVGQANVGTTFILVGKHTPTGYWVIRLPDGRECWLWGQYATVEGNINSLPEYTQPAVGKIEGELWKSAVSEIGRIDNAFVNIGLGFQEYKTGNDGKFIFEDVPVGEVVIKVRHDYYFVPTFQVFVNLGQSTPVTKIGYVPYNYPLPPTLTPTPSCPLYWPRCNIIILPTLRTFP